MATKLAVFFSIVAIGSCAASQSHNPHPTVEESKSTTTPINTQQFSNDSQKTATKPSNTGPTTTTANDSSVSNPDEHPENTLSSVNADTSSTAIPARTIFFPWCPSPKVQQAYDMPEEADQHRMVLPAGASPGTTYPVVVAFHGQPKRGKNPRDYFFIEPVTDLITKMIDNGEITPVVLVIPVFRFVGGNWPWFNPKKFKEQVIAQLKNQGITAGEWYAFGHSGAAGCGGGGLNQAHLMTPKAVGFFDTCLGDGWKNQTRTLQEKGISTVNIHSVETAGFKPRQRPEYQSSFNFGRAYEPVGLSPVKCPTVHPGDKLRKQPFKCAATNDRTVWGFVVDSGEGKEAHKAILEPAIRYFLVHFAKLGTQSTPQE